MTRPVPGAPWPTAATRAIVLLGWPARHSLSPVIHNAALREQGFDLVYLAFPTQPADLLAVVAALGAIGAVGANVTVPHKQSVVTVCDHLTPEAELIGAVNTLAWTPDGLLGDNTDATGLADAFTADVAFAPDDGIVVFGTGGAARAAVVAAGRLRARLSVVGRRVDAAEELLALGERAGARGVTVTDSADDAAVRRTLEGVRAVINATPLGMQGESLPAPFHELEPGQIAYDLIYHPPETPFLRDAHRRGVENHHGLGMLVAQAAASYRRWTGQQAPSATMSAAAIGALSDQHRRP